MQFLKTCFRDRKVLLNYFVSALKIALINGLTKMTKLRTLLPLFVFPIVLVTLFGISFTTMFTKEYSLGDIKAAVIFDFDLKKPSDYLKRVDGKRLVSHGALMAFDEIQATDFKKLIMSDFTSTDQVKAFKSVQELSKVEAFKLLRKDKLDILFVMDETFYKNYIINTATPLKLPAQIKVVTSDDNYLNRHVSMEVMTAFASQMERTWDVENLTLEQVVAAGVPFDPISFSSAMENLFDTDLGPKAVTYKMELIAGRNVLTSREYYPVAVVSLFWLFTTVYMARKPLGAYTGSLGAYKLGFWLEFWLEVFFICALQFASVLIWSLLVLKSQWVFNWGLFLVLLVALYSMASLSVLLAAYTLKANNFKGLNILESLGMYVVAFVGGSFVPLTLLPNIFKVLSKLLPNGLILNAFVLQSQGYMIWKFRSEMWLLFAMGSLFLGLSTYFIKAFHGQKN